MIIEPVPGEGSQSGRVPTLPALLQGLRAVCGKYGLLLIFDEAQTGRMFSIEYSGVRPEWS